MLKRHQALVLAGVVAAACVEGSAGQLPDDGRSLAAMGGGGDSYTTGAGGSGGGGADSQNGGTNQGGGGGGIVVFGDGGPASAYTVVGVTREVADNLRAIAAVDPTRSPQVFMKVGDSITADPGANGAFGCFASAEQQTIDLAGRTELEATIDYFDTVKLSGGQQQPGASTSWDRGSWAAVVGVTSDWAVNDGVYSGATPIDQEDSTMATHPRFAVYMLGTNDICSSPAIRNGNPGGVLHDYANSVLKATESLKSKGIIPVLTYIPPMAGCSLQSFWYSSAAGAVVRGIATAQRIPTIDAYSEMEALGIVATANLHGGNGEAGPGWYSDGLHPANAPNGECNFSGNNLQYGRNLRGLRTLEVLDKLRRVFAEGAQSIDPELPATVGSGTTAAPVVIPAVPFAYATPTAGPQAGTLSNYSSCGLTDTLDGDETVFRLDIQTEINLRALAVAGDCPTPACSTRQNVFVALFKDSLEAGNCVSAGFMVQRKFSPGTYYLVLDSARSSQPKTGVLTLQRCVEPDEDCAKCSATDAGCRSVP